VCLLFDIPLPLSFVRNHTRTCSEIGEQVKSALSIVGIRVVAVDAIGGRREVRGISEAAIVIKRASGISGWASFGEKPILGCALREDSLPAIVAVIVLLNESIGRVGL